MKVIYSDWFKYEQYPKLEMGFKLKLNEFKQAIIDNNISSLKGRNKNSDNQDKNNANFVNDVKFAQKYNLWHYHLGIPKYEKSKDGDLVSDWMLHYRLLSDAVIIVQISQHPFKFPEEKMLEQKYNFDTLLQLQQLNNNDI